MTSTTTPNNMMTVDLLKKALPSNLRYNATEELADRINNISNDPLIAEQIRENFMGYSRVLQEGKYKTEDYLNAVAYVSYKLMGDTNKDAYLKTFPGRFQQLMAQGRSDKEISAYVAAYSKGKLVNTILEQSLVPTWVLNQDLFQKAINTQAELMLTANSEKVRSDAANSLLTHLAKPKEVGPTINLDMRETSGMADLRQTLTQLARQQAELIASGVSPKTIAAQNIISSEEISEAEIK